jgi:ribosomal protein L7/L12
MISCPSCGSKNPAGVGLCKSCGATIPLEEAAPQVDADVGSPDTADPFEQSLLDLLRGGKKIEAIKVYRQQRGGDLLAAKNAVEALAAKHDIAASSGGCAGMALLLVAATIGAAATVCCLMLP